MRPTKPLDDWTNEQTVMATVHLADNEKEVTLRVGVQTGRNILQRVRDGRSKQGTRYLIINCTSPDGSVEPLPIDCIAVRRLWVVPADDPTTCNHPEGHTA